MRRMICWPQGARMEPIATSLDLVSTRVVGKARARARRRAGNATRDATDSAPVPSRTGVSEMTTSCKSHASPPAGQNTVWDGLGLSNALFRLCPSALRLPALLAMAATTATTESPELTIINRLGAIPLVSGSLSAVHETLLGSRLTAAPYSTATAVSAYALGTANKYSAPLQTRLAPLLTRADGLANAAVDAVEARYPYPFQASPDDVAQQARGAATKTFDDNVTAPAGRVVAGIDQVGALVLALSWPSGGSAARLSGRIRPAAGCFCTTLSPLVFGIATLN
jgi:hypothetical protein